MQPRPQSRSRKPGFPDLVKKVLGAEKCSGCAACAASCPYGVLGYRGERPELDGECRFCGICAKVCHKYEFDRGKVEKSFLGRERLDSEPFGVARKIVAARSADREIRKHAQDGGVA
ncbi:MAG: hypothetical protein QXF24_10025, partial [Thermoproteota archaeon]